ncbi:MAG: hypothetical protein HF314_01655 [Ignavibacteria bacterium]|jgi:hypothetical protein|nr:hypothetical protein [Ignavibacteria bacterium]MCU7501748.1 hypothetical protein [Ignavibacteria bacterium]MCU7516845.1 hypothetical protein [Ignavibacteria bacterium]
MRKDMKLDSAQLASKIEADKFLLYLGVESELDGFMHRLIELGDLKKGEDYIIYEDPVEGRNIKEYFIGYNAVEFLLRIIRGEAGVTNVGLFREIRANSRSVDKVEDYFNKLKRKYPELKEGYIPSAEEEDRIHDLKSRAVKEIRHIIDMEQG